MFSLCLSLPDSSLHGTASDASTPLDVQPRLLFEAWRLRRGRIVYIELDRTRTSAYPCQHGRFLRRRKSRSPKRRRNRSSRLLTVSYGDVRTNSATVRSDRADRVHPFSPWIHCYSTSLWHLATTTPSYHKPLLSLRLHSASPQGLPSPPSLPSTNECSCSKVNSLAKIFKILSETSSFPSTYPTALRRTLKDCCGT